MYSKLGRIPHLLYGEIDEAARITRRDCVHINVIATPRYRAYAKSTHSHIAKQAQNL